MPQSLAKALPPKATLGLFAPSSPFSQAAFEQGTTFLESLGFTLRYTPELFAQQGYLAGSDERRLNEFKRLLQDPEVSALWAVRGGYGALRLIDALDPAFIQRHPKMILGFSDLSALHLANAAFGGAPTCHAPQVTSLSLAKEATRAALFRLIGEPDFTGDLLTEQPCLRPGRVKGRLYVSNLALLVALLGTPYLPDFTGAILAIEDVNEEPYRVDRMLTQLALSGVLRRLSGLVVGRFTRARDTDGKDENVILGRIGELLARFELPAIGPCPFGHIDDNHALPEGGWVELDAGAGRLTLLSPIVC